MVNYESKQNCFDRIRDIKSYCLYGSHKFPIPWMTVFIPTYKRTYLLKQAIESVLTQLGVGFEWEIIVLDNEPYDGKPNANEILISNMDSDRIVYYRNETNLKVADNFNRGFELAKSKWVMMLHDDDLLIINTMYKMGELIKHYEKLEGKKLGAISAQYYQFVYSQENDEILNIDLAGVNQWFLWNKMKKSVYQLTNANVLFTGNIGGDVPSNGAVYLRDAVFEIGGFNEEYGISGDLILYYCMEKKYRVYSTLEPMGFYRWGHNTMCGSSSANQTIDVNKSFREFVFSKSFFHKIFGFFFENSLNYELCTLVVNMQSNVMRYKDNNYKGYDYDIKKPNRLIHSIFKILRRIYYWHKNNQSIRLEKRAYSNKN